ncbi:MAG TPA: DsbA family protein [Caulobacteraceae bacterium]|nr:DsbA family protein [Caulobacteraceae bacterium]
MNLLQASRSPLVGLVARRPKLTLALALAAGLALAFASRLAPRATRIGYTPVVEEVLNDTGLPASGANRPLVTLAVFSDYQCPICRANEPALEKVVKRRNDVRLLYVDWPIFGPASTLAAEYALAANEQGRYVLMHRALMSARPPFTAAALDQIARSAGVDVPRLHRDLVADRTGIEARLAKNRVEAWVLGLQGTPAYLTGPYLWVGSLGEGGLLRTIDRAKRDLPPETGAQS